MQQKLDFVFKSHSSANPIPQCIENFQSEFSDLRTEDDYASEFSRFCINIGTKYAIPFASNHCYLHRETKKFNKFAVRPENIKPLFEKYKKEKRSKSELIIMPPGSTWDSNFDKFKIKDFDYSNSEEYIVKLEKKYQIKLEKQYDKEDSVIGDFIAFKNYFTKFFKSVPWFYKRSLKKKNYF